MTARTVTIIPGPRDAGNLHIANGTKVRLPSGEFLPGVTRVTLVAFSGDVWRAVIECHAALEGDITALDDTETRYARVTWGVLLRAVWAKLRGR